MSLLDYIAMRTFSDRLPPFLAWRGSPPPEADIDHDHRLCARLYFNADSTADRIRFLSLSFVPHSAVVSPILSADSAPSTPRLCVRSGCDSAPTVSLSGTSDLFLSRSIGLV